MGLLIDFDRQLLVLVTALVLDRIAGDPDWLWRRVPHPVAIFGAAIGFLDRGFNRKDATPETRRRNGVLALVLLVGGAVIAGLLLHALFVALGWLGFLLEAGVVAVMLAQKSLADHVRAVLAALEAEGVAGGRRAVSMIVGRDPQSLDEAAISRAAIESLAENFSDGVVAPALWYAVLGLPGLFFYKMVNTADSMIGHLTPRHADFGHAAARTDDWVNWPAARLSAALIALAVWAQNGFPAARRAIGTALRDHGLHRSPNAGWPEAAMAGALDVALAGPRAYGGRVVREPMLNAAGRAAGVATIAPALAAYGRACTTGTVLAAAAWLIACA